MAAALQAFIQEIEGTIGSSSRERRGAMVRHLTDFFLVGSDQYNDDEIALIDDLFVRLVDSIEESSRALLALRFGPLSKAPPKLLRILANDNAIEVASPILIQSEQLDDASLLACAKTKSQEHLLAISRRKTLVEALTDILVERGDEQVVLSTARNAGARFSSNGFNILVRRSEDDDRLAYCVGTRPDIPSPLFRKLLEVASTVVRLKLEAEWPAAKRDIRSVVKDVTSQIRDREKGELPEYASAQALINSLNLAGQLNAAKLQAFAEADRFEEVVAALSLMSDMPVDFVERTVSDAHGETLLFLSRSIELPWDATRSILELGNKRHRRSPIETENYLAAYHRLKQETARQILEFHRTRARVGAESAKRRRSLPDC